VYITDRRSPSISQSICHLTVYYRINYWYSYSLVKSTVLLDKMETVIDVSDEFQYFSSYIDIHLKFIKQNICIGNFYSDFQFKSASLS